MRLLVLSDLHVEFAPFDAGLGAQRIDQGVDVVVLAGDIHVSSQGLVWARQTFPNKPIVYVPGNHEYDGLEFAPARERAITVRSGGVAPNQSLASLALIDTVINSPTFSDAL